MSAELDAPSDAPARQTSIVGQIFKAQRVASRRLAMQFLYALDTRFGAIHALEQELAKFPARIEEAKQEQFKAEHTPPPVDEEGNPLPVAKPTVPLSDQLAVQQGVLANFLVQERETPPTLTEEEQEAFYGLAEEIWSESVPVQDNNDPIYANGVPHRIIRKGWSRARKLIDYVVSHHEEIDQLVAQAAQNWRLDRMSCVDRNILRVATGELKMDPTVNAAIVINEAVEMAKAYGQKDSWRFVNGVLDRIRKDLAEAPLVIDGSSESSTSK